MAVTRVSDYFVVTIAQGSAHQSNYDRLCLICCSRLIKVRSDRDFTSEETSLLLRPVDDVCYHFSPLEGSKHQPSYEYSLLPLKILLFTADVLVLLI